MKSFASVFARAFFVFGMMAAPAWAIGDAPAPAVKEAAPAAEKKADPKCEGITLTGEKFLDMFYAIAMHGDLTDVPFIEKTLETKFEVWYKNGTDKHNQGYKVAHYTSKTFYGAPIEVELSFDIKPQPQIGAIMRLESGIWKCLAITPPQFNQRFGGTPIGDNGSHAGIITVINAMKDVGKGGSEIQVIYSYNHRASNKTVYMPAIEQRWK